MRHHFPLVIPSLALASILAACTFSNQPIKTATLDEKLPQLRTGMTRDQVIAILGQPDHVNRRPGYRDFIRANTIVPVPATPLPGLENVPTSIDSAGFNEFHYRKPDGTFLTITFDDQWCYDPSFLWHC